LTIQIAVIRILRTFGDKMSEIPVFKFALREDLKDDKRFLPTRGEPKATGWDVRVALPPGQTELVVQPFDYIKVSLGFRAFCPEGWWLELRPRSSSFAKKNLHALYGVVDETYEGEMVFAAQYVVNVEAGDSFQAIFRPSLATKPSLTLNHGDSIGQLIPIRRQEMQVEQITNEDYENACKARAGARGAGGFGSTGK
jgi:dUTPase